MPLYARIDSVKRRLEGKVRFRDDDGGTAGEPDDPNAMGLGLLTDLIDEAEGDVEQDLSLRYNAPFQPDNGGKFADLPLRPTRLVLRTLAELKAVIRVLETDFGRGSAANGDAYKKEQEDRYAGMVKKLLQRRDSGGWLFPPLPQLQLNYQNQAADDGFSGRILHSTRGGEHAERQINDPSRNFWIGFGWDHFEDEGGPH